MSGPTTETHPDRVAAHGESTDRHGRLAPAEERGDLRIDARVVEKIAATAAIEVAHVGGTARRLLTFPLGSDTAAHRPRVNARVEGKAVTMTVDCSVAYPAPVASVIEQLRAHLIDRIAALTGLETGQIDVTVSKLTDVRSIAHQDL